MLTDGDDESVAFDRHRPRQRAGRGSGSGVADGERAREWALPLRCARDRDADRLHGLLVRGGRAGGVADARRRGRQPRGADIRHLAAGRDLRRRADRIDAAGRQRSAGAPGGRLDPAPMLPGEAVEVRLRPRAAWSCAWTPTATSAGATSSSACSTCPSCPRRCAICSRTAVRWLSAWTSSGSTGAGCAAPARRCGLRWP